jgi:5-methylcytosine-specific restriction protein A
MAHGTPERRLSGRRWQRIRERVLRRAPLCYICLAASPQRVTVALEVDHVRPLSQQGTDDDSNLAGICKPCHLDKSARERGAKPKRAFGVDGLPVDGSWR